MGPDTDAAVGKYSGGEPGRRRAATNHVPPRQRTSATAVRSPGPAKSLPRRTSVRCRTSVTPSNGARRPAAVNRTSASVGRPVCSATWSSSQARRVGKARRASSELLPVPWRPSVSSRYQYVVAPSRTARPSECAGGVEPSGSATRWRTSTPSRTTSSPSRVSATRSPGSSTSRAGDGLGSRSLGLALGLGTPALGSPGSVATDGSIPARSSPAAPRATPAATSTPTPSALAPSAARRRVRARRPAASSAVVRRAGTAPARCRSPRRGDRRGRCGRSRAAPVVTW